jgi:hypothetical protein
MLVSPPLVPALLVKLLPQAANGKAETVAKTKIARTRILTRSTTRRRAA